MEFNMKSSMQELTTFLGIGLASVVSALAGAKEVLSRQCK